MIIVAFGLPGSGKSFFAERLSDKLGATHINSDKIRNTLGSRGKYSLHDKLIVYHAMADKVSECIAEGKDAVVDGTFSKRDMINIFVDLARRLQSSICFIKVEADEALVKARLSIPRKDSEADYNVYLKIKAELEPPDVPYITLHSETDNINTMLDLALEYIGEIHE